ncbi:MAG: EamA family transporter [Clostridia bacterium]|nr:EamA family transporter [Clostridia bacterium]
MNFLKKFPSISILIAAGLWGLTGLFVRKLNTSGLDNMQLLFFRSSITAVTMSVYLLLTDKSQMKINPKDWWYFFGTGILSFALFGFCYFYTISHASMSVAAILLYTSPFFVMLMASVFFREKITAAKIIALIMAAAGCFMICGTDHNVSLTPFVIFTGIASGFCYALYSIFGRVALKKYSSATVTAYTFIFAAIGSMFVVDFPQIYSVMTVNPQAIMLTVIFSFISAVFPYIFYTNGLKYVDAGKASIMATFEAVVAAISGIIAFGESITLIGIIGIVFVLSAVGVLNKK